MTCAVAALDGGTRVDTAEAVSHGISEEDHATALASSLENLAAPSRANPAPGERRSDSVLLGTAA